MRISVNWIKDFVNLDGIDLKELALKFTMATAEVDDVIEIGKDINNVVVGRVIRVEPHPSSEKLKVVQVDLGGEIVQSVCGAPNVREGILVPFAKVGGSIKKVEKVLSTKLAGVESNGILCSASEIGISDDHSGVMVFEEDYKLGTYIKTIIDMEDTIIEVDNKSLTNRPDLWGHYGIAREIAAITGRPLKKLEVSGLEESNSLPKLDIEVLDTEKCFRYSGLTIDNITQKTSPINMQTRLYYCGMRPISLLVDLTNYLMLELGQPMHAFDKRFMEKVVVKSTTEPTKFKTLDGVEREIPSDVLMICNQNGPVAIAGVMGGENSEVAEDTTSILLESANFEPYSTRKNASKIGLRTEASARYEKTLDPEITALATKRFVKLLNDIDANAKVSSSLTDVYNKKYDKIMINIDKPYIDKYIGYDIDIQTIENTLRALEYGVKRDGNSFTIEVPSFRATKDITMKVDIIEEISRIYGYDNIQPKTTKVALEPNRYNEDRIIDHKAKEVLSERFGYSEVHSYIWYDNKANTRLGIGLRDGLKILNPNAEESDTLRDSMAPIMLNFAAENRKNYDEFGMFEIGSVFSIEKDHNEFEEHKNLCIFAASKKESEDALFYKLKGITDSLFKVLKNVEVNYTLDKIIMDYPWVHPAKSAVISIDGDVFGYISVVHPKIKENVDKKLNMVVVELNMFKVHNIEESKIKFKEPSKYPEVTLDYSLLVDKTLSFDKINNDLSQFKHSLLLSHSFVGIYEGKGLPEDKKSMTFTFRIGSTESTLSSEQIEEFSSSLINYINNIGYSLR